MHGTVVFWFVPFPTMDKGRFQDNEVPELGRYTVPRGRQNKVKLWG